MKEFDSLYFVGAGGIGMAALERYFLAKGKRVAGYDRTPSDLTHELEQEGVHIDYDESPDLIPDYCRDPERTLVVYTPAVPASHQGLTYFRENQQIPILLVDTENIDFVENKADYQHFKELITNHYPAGIHRIIF